MLLFRITRLAKSTVRSALPQSRHLLSDASRRHDVSSAAVAELRQSDAQATVVPRPAGVTDGRWDREDQAAVDLALADAQKSVKKRPATQPGIMLAYCSLILHDWCR